MKPDIQGFEETDAGANASAVWQPFSERRVRVAIVGEGVCSFGSQFGYQTHPNAEVVAVSDLDPALCRALQERTRAKKAYPTFEELLKHAEEDRVEAVYIATDAPSRGAPRRNPPRNPASGTRTAAGRKSRCYRWVVEETGSPAASGRGSTSSFTM